MQFKRDRSPDQTDYLQTFKQQVQCDDRVSILSAFGNGRVETNSKENCTTTSKQTQSQTQRGCECHVTGCNQSFASVVDFEEHYRLCHSFVCRYCQRFYATNQHLEIHLLEAHDSFFAVMAKQQPMYQCVEATCKQCFMDSRSRDEHATCCHGYPSHFKFDRRQQDRMVDVTGGAEENRDVSVHGGRKKAGSCQPSQTRFPDTISFGIGGSELFRVQEAKASGRSLQDPMDAT